MLRELSEEVRVTLKDRLRDVRHVVRQHRLDGAPPRGLLPRPPFPVPGIEDLLGHAVNAFDDAMTFAQALVPVDRPAPEAGARARSFTFYFQPGDDEEAFAGARGFRRDLYYLARNVVAKQGIAGVRIHEADLAAVHTAMRERHAGHLAALGAEAPWPQRVSAGAALCSALLIELLDHRPLRFDDEAAARPADARRRLEILCLAPVVLACGFATVDPEAAQEPDLVDIAILATEARIDRILAACSETDTLGELTRLFATLLAHLP